VYPVSSAARAAVSIVIAMVVRLLATRRPARSSYNVTYNVRNVERYSRVGMAGN
jgi:hypothetical protein